MRVLEMHARFKVIQRSKCQSATAAAAYRAAERIYDERTGEWKDYTHKSDVEHTALLLPDNAPEWAHDRSALWNAAEKKENRSNSQPAREIEFSFPREFTPEQRHQAGYQIGQELVSRYGAAVDIAFHVPEPDEAKGRPENPHAHFLFTVRRFDAEQPDGWAKKKNRELDDRTKDENGHTKATAEILSLRERMAGIVNDIAAEHGHDVFTEHLSFEQRGLGREPTIHLGPHAADMEQRGRRSDLGDKNREIQARNLERERAEAQLNIIDLAIERELRQQRSESIPQAEEREFLTTAAQRREAFYERSQAERTAMLSKQQENYGQREQELREELAALHYSTERTGFLGFVRFWHTITGRRAEEQQRIEALQAEYDRISAAKAAETALFEQNRQRQLEVLKIAEAEMEHERAAPARVGYHEAAQVHDRREAAKEAIRQRVSEKQQDAGRDHGNDFDLGR